ncbi:MAG: haloacid dehalogenase type II [Pseudomonadota bacterium]
MNSAFNNIQACVFDAYGTLFDVHSAVAKHRDAMGDQADQLSMLWRTKQLEYTWLRSLMGKYTDFWQVTQDALDFALETVGLDKPELRDDLMQAYLELDAYPEVIDVLKKLRASGMRTAILTNGSPDMIAAAVENSGIADLLDACLSVESVGIFKPDPRIYQLAVDSLGVDASNISFQSSNAWDAAGASSFGMRVAWVNRFGQSVERLPGNPDAELRDLTSLPDLVARNA